MTIAKKSDRAATLIRTRDLKMARSAHAFVRGSTAKFYEWLAASDVNSKIPTGPKIWICGDCHLGNLGPISDGDGNIEVQIRDLDQTVIGNPAHDIIRLALSLATAARSSDLPGVTTARIIEQMIEGYQQALVEPDDDDAAPEPAVVRSVKRRAMGRGWNDLARERLEDERPKIPLGTKFWAIDGNERHALESLFREPGIQKQILLLDPRNADRDVSMIDAAYWMKGCSSLGLLRYAVLISIKGARGRPNYALVDVKEAIASSATVAPYARMPRDPATRVVAGACALSPNLGNRTIATRLLGKSVFIRELAPQDLKIEIEQFSYSEALKAAYCLANVIGKAHGRQMTRSDRATWRQALRLGETGNLDAPSWLWKSVVELSAVHEAGYLEHCRRFALEASTSK